MPKSLQQLIEEYQNLTYVCAKIDYADKKSVKANNKAVGRMYQIVEAVKADFGVNGVQEFVKLLDITDNNSNVWAAYQSLERLPVSQEVETKALNIIERIASGTTIDALGAQSWLKDWKEKK